MLHGGGFFVLNNMIRLGASYRREWRAQYGYEQSKGIPVCCKVDADGTGGAVGGAGEHDQRY